MAEVERIFFANSEEGSSETETSAFQMNTFRLLKICAFLQQLKRRDNNENVIYGVCIAIGSCFSLIPWYLVQIIVAKIS